MINLILSINNHQVIKNYIFSACKKKYKLSFFILGAEGSIKTDVSNNNTNLWLKRHESNYCNAVNATKPRRVGLNLNNLEF